MEMLDKETMKQCRNVVVDAQRTEQTALVVLDSVNAMHRSLVLLLCW